VKDSPESSPEAVRVYDTDTPVYPVRSTGAEVMDGSVNSEPASRALPPDAVTEPVEVNDPRPPAKSSL
jgi:hypothetical protein